MTLVVLVAIGLLAGTTSASLGVGGGIVIVPVLFHVFSELGVDASVRMHLAVGTSLATIDGHGCPSLFTGLSVKADELLAVMKEDSLGIRRQR